MEGVLGAGREGRTLIVLTGDHGESLGEHGEKTHGIFAYEATLHVPLILFAPRLMAARVVEDEVGHVDVLPTVLDALGMPLPAGLSGWGASFTPLTLKVTVLAERSTTTAAKFQAP